MTNSRSILLTLLFVAPVLAQDWFVADQHVDRKLARVAYFSETGSPGQFAIDYCAPPWKDEYDAKIDDLKGHRERLGKDFWTRLDTSLDLTIGGVKVAAGDYYLAIGRTQSGDWKLVLFPAPEIRKMHGDGFITNKLPMTLGMEVPLTYAKAADKAGELKIELKADKDKVGNATLVLQWGKHQLTAPIVANVGKPTAAPTK